MNESRKVRAKYPDRIPIIACRDKNSSIPDIDRNKFLCPATMTAGEFCYVLRRRIELDPSQAMFMFTEKGTLLPTATTLSDLYSSHQDVDGYLYIIYASENTFGGPYSS